MGSSSDHHKSHSKHSKHKKHKHHHKHKHRHKKSHKRDKSHNSNHEVDLASDILGKTLKSLEHKEEINSSTLELVMTEHLLSQLEAAQDESDNDSESSADEKPKKSPVPSQKTIAIINDPQVTSTSSMEPSNKPSNGEPSNKPSNRVMTINIISKTLPSIIESMNSNDDDKMESKKSSSVIASGLSDDVIVTYSNLRPTESSSTNGTTTDTAAEGKASKQSEGDNKERKNRKRSSSRSPSRSKESSKRRRRSRSHSRSRRSRSRDRRRSRDKRSRSRDRGYKSKRRSRSRDRSRRSRSRDRSKRSRSRDRSKRSRSRDRSKRSRSRDRRSRSKDRSKRSRSRDRSRRSSYRHRSRSPRRSYSQRKSPRRRHRSSSSRSKSRSSSRPPSRSSSKARMEAESESNFSRYQVVQSVSQIAKEFGSLKRHIEIGKLTSLCAQLQDSPASTMKGGAMGGAKGTSHEYRAPYEVNTTTRTFEPRLTNQVQSSALVVLPRRPVEEVFPVSTGVEHAGVEKSVATGDNVFEQTRSMPVNELITKRLEMTQRLTMNPGDTEARMTLSLIEQQMSLWAQSGMKPGQYTGKQTLNPLSTEVHRTGFQTWAKKKMFHHLAPVIGGFGLKMLKKMGWQEGCPLGIHGRGQVEPIALDVKTDRSGLKSSKETVATGAASSSGSGQPKSMVTPSAIAQSKHPVSALQEISQKRHWSIPRYEMATPTDGMPFLFKVILSIGSYVPLAGSCTKKEAKVNAAAVALSGLGLTPKTLEYTFSAL